MYINRVIYKTIGLDRFKKTIVSDRVKKYLEDLYARYQADQNMDTLQLVYSHDEMGNYLLNEIQQVGALMKADTIFFPAWGVSWSMDYAAHELHWKKVFGLNCKLLDVRDCGSLCVYYAIHIMLKLYMSKALKNVLICSIEHAWLFCKNKIKIHAPKISYIGSFQCSNDSVFNSKLEILSCDIVNNVRMNEINNHLDNIILKILENYKIKSTDCHVWIRKFENIVFHHKFHLIEHPMSSGFLYTCIDLILKSKKNTKNDYFLIIDFDPLRLSIGAVFIKRLLC